MKNTNKKSASSLKMKLENEKSASTRGYEWFYSVGYNFEKTNRMKVVHLINQLILTSNKLKSMFQILNIITHFLRNTVCNNCSLFWMLFILSQERKHFCWTTLEKPTICYVQSSKVDFILAEDTDDLKLVIIGSRIYVPEIHKS